AADVAEDAVELGGGGGRGELPGDGPARLAAGHAELPLQSAVVHLDHDPVDLEVERIAAALPPAAALSDLIDAVQDRDLVVDLEAPLAQPLERFGVALRLPTPQRGAAVAPDGQRSCGGDRRIQLAQGAGGGVPRVGEGREPVLGALLVHLGEAGDRQVDLAAYLDELRRVLDGERDRLDGLQVLRDVLAHAAVA